MSKAFTVFTDGGARGNPGPAGIGIVFLSKETGEPVFSQGVYIGEATNNVAEYTAVIKALEKAKELDASSLSFFLDSELVVKQINGQYRVKEPHLQTLHAKVLALKKPFAQVTFAHVRREKNKEADLLVNEAIDRR